MSSVIQDPQDGQEDLLALARRAVPNAVRAHDWRTEAGRLVNLHIKKDDGDWCWRGIDNRNGGVFPHRLTVPGLEPLWRYWQAKAALNGQGVRVLVICEGEKDTGRAWSDGHIAVCYPDGATGKKWTDELTAAVADLRPSLIVVIADNDAGGRASAEHIALKLKAAGFEVRRKLPPAVGHDLSNHLDAGHGYGDLRTVETFTPTPAEETQLSDGSRGGRPSTGQPTFEDDHPGNARFFAHHYGDQVRWDVEQGRWLRYEGQHWSCVREELIGQLALDAMERRLKEARRANNELAIRWAAQSMTHYHRSALLKDVRMIEPVLDRGAWDTSRELIGCGTGDVDLRASRGNSGHPERRITLKTNVPYYPDATCPRWERFLKEVFDGDQELIDYVQRFVGYTLTGETSEQCMAVLYGEAPVGFGNGKSTFLKVLRALLGEYSMTLSASALTSMSSKSMTAKSYELAALPGKRLVTCSEVPRGALMNEALVKALTGEDELVAEAKYGRPFYFTPQAKFWLAVNDLPKAQHDAPAFWSRIRVIPFVKQFPRGTADAKALDALLMEELPGILAWAVRGAVQWYKAGLAPTPACVELATEEYRQRQNPLQDFFDACCEFDATAAVQMDLFSAFITRWFQNVEGGKPPRGWTTQLKHKGVKPGSLDKQPAWRGVRLKSEIGVPEA